MSDLIPHALIGQSRTTPLFKPGASSGTIRAALAHHLARWQPALLLGLALLVGGLLRFAGLYDRLEPIHRESELVILAYTRAPDDWLCTAFAAIGPCRASMSPTAPQAVESYGPGERRAGPAVVWRRLLGVGPGAIERGRLASAIAGLATIVACWWAARVLAGPIAASVAAHAYAIAPLAVIPNRLALPVSTATLCLVLAVGCVALAYQRQRSRALALPGLALLALAGLLDGAVAAAIPPLLLAAVVWHGRAGTLGRMLASYMRSRRGLLGLLAGIVVVAAMVGVGYSRLFQAVLVARNLAWTLVFDLPVGGWVALVIGAYFVARLPSQSRTIRGSAGYGGAALVRQHGTPAAQACAAAAMLLTVTAGLMDLLGGRGSAPDVLPALALWVIAAATLAPRLVDRWNRLRANAAPQPALAVAAALVTVSLVIIPALLLSTRWSLDPANAEVSPNEQWEYQAGQESGVGCAALVDTLRTLSAAQPLTAVGLGSRHSCLRMRIVTESLPITWQDNLPPSAAPPFPAPPTGLLLAQAEYLGGQRVRSLDSRALAPSGWDLLLRIRRPQGVYGYALYRPSNPQR